jgi:NitT/TauT family transport system permease protein
VTTIQAQAPDHKPNAAQTRPPVRIKVSRTSTEVALARIGFLVVILILWQVFAGGPKSALPKNVVGQPSSVWRTFWQLVGNDQLLSALGATLENFALGLIIAAPIGIAIGMFTSTRIGKWLLEPALTMLYAIPKVALITLYVLILGIGTKSHVWLVISAAVFVYYFAAEQAIRDLDHDRIVRLRLMGAGPVKVGTAYILPAAIPALLAATRIAIPLAFTAEIFAELKIPASTGLGVLLTNYEQFLNGAGTMAIFLFIVAIAYAFDLITAFVLNRYTRSIGFGAQT